MAEDYEQNEQQEEHDADEGQSLWEILNRENSGDSDQYEDEQEEQDEEIAKEDKLEKKFSAKMDNMQKKFEQTMLRERIAKFEVDADELTLDMFKTVASDVKSLEDFDKALNVVNKQAAELRKKAAEYQERLEAEAQDRTAKAWGTGPLGTPTKRGADEEEDRKKRIEKGDTQAGLSALLEGDSMVSGIIS
jgi:hypothetical protein